MQSIKTRLLQLPDRRSAFEHIKVFELLFANQCLSSAVLTGGASATVTTGAAFNAMVGGQMVGKATGVSLAALGGPNVPNTATPFQLWIITMDAAGNTYSYPSTPAATLAGLAIPTIPATVPAGVTGAPATAAGSAQIVIGTITMNNGSVGTFIPGTTLLNVASLGIVYNNTIGPFFPIPPL